MVLKQQKGGVSLGAVWEWCKNVWYSNSSCRDRTGIPVWEWCKNVWYSNYALMGLARERFENDVKMYGTQTISLQSKI